MTQADYDLCIIGSGINGAGIARDAAGRGLSVLLVEAQDLAGATSSASTKLIHGGLRYLEYFEFGLVRESLTERETLLRLAPHIVQPMEFVLPHNKNLRPAWMIGLGLFLYDHLGRRKKLPSSQRLDLDIHSYGDPLQDQYTKGFSYADCRVDDARLVILNALDAAERGATILTRTACTKLSSDGTLWHVHLKDMITGKNFEHSARKVVNAAGPWVRGFLDESGLSDENTPAIRLVKGSHIIVPRLFEGDQAYILQHPDDRVIFAIPYEQDYTLIGTTEVDYKGSSTEITIEQGEVDYLCHAINNSFNKQIKPEDIVWTYSGVRPLLDDGHQKATAATRDYQLVMNTRHGPPLLSVFGGKITTYRKLSEQVVNKLCSRGFWTDTESLPGGDIPHSNFPAFLHAQQGKYSWMPENLIHRYAYTYGTRMDSFLGEAKSLDDLGRHYGDHVYKAEISYLVEKEWARTVEDILWRRTKLGLHISEETLRHLEMEFV